MRPTSAARRAVPRAVVVSILYCVPISSWQGRVAHPARGCMSVVALEKSAGGWIPGVREWPLGSGMALLLQRLPCITRRRGESESEGGERDTGAWPERDAWRAFSARPPANEGWLLGCTLLGGEMAVPVCIALAGLPPRSPLAPSRSHAVLYCAVLSCLVLRGRQPHYGARKKQTSQQRADCHGRAVAAAGAGRNACTWPPRHHLASLAAVARYKLCGAPIRARSPPAST